jgi:hypothetical protein
MKTAYLRLVSVLILGLLTGGSASAAGEGSEIITLGAQGWREQPARLSVASGGTLTLDVLIPTSLDRASVLVELWQTSGNIMLPLGKALPMDGLLATAIPDANGVTTLRVAFPKLERRARVLVKFISKDAPNTALGVVLVTVYPPIDWAPLARKVKKDDLRLVVFGKDTVGLREFFEARHIPFSDNGDNMPERLGRDTVAVGELSPKDWAERKDRITPEGGRLIVFVADAEVLPGVYSTAVDEGTVTKVTIPLLANLAKDPRNEAHFLQLIEQHLQPAPVATP